MFPPYMKGNTQLFPPPIPPFVFTVRKPVKSLLELLCMVAIEDLFTGARFFSFLKYHIRPLCLDLVRCLSLTSDLFCLKGVDLLPNNLGWLTVLWFTKKFSPFLTTLFKNSIISSCFVPISPDTLDNGSYLFCCISSLARKELLAPSSSYLNDEFSRTKYSVFDNSLPDELYGRYLKFSADTGFLADLFCLRCFSENPLLSNSGTKRLDLSLFSFSLCPAWLILIVMNWGFACGSFPSELLIFATFWFALLVWVKFPMFALFRGILFVKLRSIPLPGILVNCLEPSSDELSGFVFLGTTEANEPLLLYLKFLEISMRL